MTKALDALRSYIDAAEDLYRIAKIAIEDAAPDGGDYEMTIGVTSIASLKTAVSEYSTASSRLKKEKR